MAFCKKMSVKSFFFLCRCCCLIFFIGCNGFWQSWHYAAESWFSLETRRFDVSWRNYESHSEMQHAQRWWTDTFSHRLRFRGPIQNWARRHQILGQIATSLEILVVSWAVGPAIEFPLQQQRELEFCKKRCIDLETRTRTCRTFGIPHRTPLYFCISV